MIMQAKNKLKDVNVKSFLNISSQNMHFNNEFDICTAIQCHHYLNKNERKRAVLNCFNSLKIGGVFVYFENIAPEYSDDKSIFLKLWRNYQLSQGRELRQITEHLQRYGKDYFPITVTEHLQLLKECGFSCSEIFWRSCVQAGFFAIK